MIYSLYCWNSCLTKFFDFSIYDRIAILFCATQKTAAFGVPMITTLYEESSNLGLYTVPLLLFHPMQLVIDSLLVSPLQKRVLEYEQKHSKNYYEKGRLQNEKNSASIDISRLSSQSAMRNNNNNKNKNNDSEDSMQSDKDYDSSSPDGSDKVMLGGGIGIINHESAPLHGANDNIAQHVVVDEVDSDDNDNAATGQLLRPPPMMSTVYAVGTKSGASSSNEADAELGRFGNNNRGVNHH